MGKGGDLKSVFDHTPEVEFDEEHTLIMLYNLLCSLKFIHKAGIIHRDEI